jgi:hypothetical protein
MVIARPSARNQERCPLARRSTTATRLTSRATKTRTASRTAGPHSHTTKSTRPRTTTKGTTSPGQTKADTTLGTSPLPTDCQDGFLGGEPGRLWVVDENFKGHRPSRELGRQVALDGRNSLGVQLLPFVDVFFWGRRVILEVACGLQENPRSGCGRRRTM